MENLKNCPFCGSDNLKVVYENTAYVTCLSCDCKGPEHGEGGPHTDYIDRECAIESWNIRKRGK